MFTYQNQNSNKPASGFTFSKRTEKVNWRKIASIDIERVSRDIDFQVLQENISHVTFCSIEEEVDMRYVDPNFLKLFKLAQFIIEYLLHTQEYLTNSFQTLESKLKNAECQSEEETKKNLRNEELILELKKENKRRRKLLETQQNSLVNVNSSAGICHCPYCTKSFLKHSFLQNHISRRHPGLDNVRDSKSPSPSPETSGVKDLEKEICSLKEQVKATEKILEAERKDIEIYKLTSKAESTNKEEEMKTWLELWQKSQAEQSREEIEKLTTMFMNEIKILTDKNKASEQALEELETRWRTSVLPKPTSLGDLVDASSSNKEGAKTNLAKSDTELDKIKSLLQNQLDEMAENINQKLEANNQQWMTKLKTLTVQHGNQLKELRDTLESSQAHFSQEDHSQPEISKLLQFCQNQEKQLKSQQTKLDQLLNMQIYQKSHSDQEYEVAGDHGFRPSSKRHQATVVNTLRVTQEPVFQESIPLPRPPKKEPSTTRPILVTPKHSDKPKVDKKKTKKGPKKDSFRERVTQSPKQSPKYFSITSKSVPSSYTRSRRLANAIKKSPALLTSWKSEIKDVLNDKLKSLGVSSKNDAINETTLQKKMLQLQSERAQLQKSSGGREFDTLRKQWDLKSQKLAQKKLKERLLQTKSDSESESTTPPSLSVKKKVTVDKRSRTLEKPIQVKEKKSVNSSLPDLKTIRRNSSSSSLSSDSEEVQKMEVTKVTKKEIDFATTSEDLSLQQSADSQSVEDQESINIIQKFSEEVEDVTQYYTPSSTFKPTKTSTLKPSTKTLPSKPQQAEKKTSFMDNETTKVYQQETQRTFSVSDESKVQQVSEDEDSENLWDESDHYEPSNRVNKTKVSALAKSIEHQLDHRTAKKPAGSINIMPKKLDFESENNETTVTKKETSRKESKSSSKTPHSKEKKKKDTNSWDSDISLDEMFQVP